MKKNKKILIAIISIAIALMAIALVTVIIVANNRTKINTKNLIIKRETLEKINNSEIEKILYDYLIAEIDLFNSNKKNTTIEQTNESEELKDYIENLIDYDNEEFEINKIYFEFTDISRTMILEQPNSVKGDKMQSKMYGEYMLKVKEAIENVINNYCVYETQEEREQRIQAENSNVYLYKVNQENNTYYINDFGYIKSEESQNDTYVLELTGITINKYIKYVNTDLFNNLKALYSALQNNNISSTQVSVDISTDDVEVNFKSENKTLKIESFENFSNYFQMVLMIMQEEKEKSGVIIIDDTGGVYFRELSD